MYACASNGDQVSGRNRQNGDVVKCEREILWSVTSTLQRLILRISVLFTLITIMCVL